MMFERRQVVSQRTRTPKLLRGVLDSMDHRRVVEEPVRLCLVEPERFSYQFDVGAIFVRPKYAQSNNLNLRLPIGTTVFLKCTGIYVLRVSAAQKDHEADFNVVVRPWVARK